MPAARENAFVVLTCVSLAAGGALLVVGLVSPALAFIPNGTAGPVGDIVGLLTTGKAPATETVSTLGSIRKLFEHGEYLLGALILLGSALLPFARLWLLLAALLMTLRGHNTAPAIALMERISKYCLLDVMILALIAASLTQVVPGLEVALRWGVYLTAGAVLATALSPWLILKLSRVEE